VLFCRAGEITIARASLDGPVGRVLPLEAARKTQRAMGVPGISYARPLWRGTGPWGGPHKSKLSPSSRAHAGSFGTTADHEGTSGDSLQLSVRCDREWAGVIQRDTFGGDFESDAFNRARFGHPPALTAASLLRPLAPNDLGFQLISCRFPKLMQLLLGSTRR